MNILNTRPHIRMTPLMTIVFCLLFINVLGTAVLYSSLHQGGRLMHPEVFYRQLIWITVAWTFLIVFSFIDYRVYYDLGFVVYGISVVLLLIVDFAGKTAMGATRWLSFGGFNFQPSELSKVATIFLLARFFSGTDGLRSFKHGTTVNQSFWRTVLLPFMLICANALLIFKQPDLGSALLLVFMFFLIGLASRVKKWYFIAMILCGVIAMPFAWHILKDYQKKRLVVFINPNVDPLGAGYTIIQSKIAIGSGKALGKGFLSGTQNQFNFLPERHTDFIFTVIAEEWGQIGSLFLLLIFWLILRKILDKTEVLHDSFAAMLCIGITTFFFLHVFINIGMTLGILPVVGIPLTMISYGGSNIMIAFMLLGIFLNICRTT